MQGADGMEYLRTTAYKIYTLPASILPALYAVVKIAFASIIVMGTVLIFALIAVAGMVYGYLYNTLVSHFRRSPKRSTKPTANTSDEKLGE